MMNVMKPGSIKLDKITFNYPGAQTPTLKNISLNISAGERIAIVGLNGAGKTTLIKIICGLYRPTAGNVYIDNVKYDRYAFVIMVCLQGNVGIGDITKYASALILLVSGFSSLIKNYQSLINNNNYLEKYFSYFEIPEEVEMKQKYENEGSQVDYTIEFKNVSFSYPNTNYFALKNISFVISSGEKVAIVGKNGSGKTTMIKLLCRLYNPDEGEIYVNGQNIRDINFNDYIKILSVVFQDYKLFAFSLKQNIVLAE